MNDKTKQKWKERPRHTLMQEKEMERKRVRRRMWKEKKKEKRVNWRSAITHGMSNSSKKKEDAKEKKLEEAQANRTLE